jgi:adenylosuccinate synthase
MPNVLNFSRPGGLAVLAAGATFGDEGKGTLIDFLARLFGDRCRLVIKFTGGPQAAHFVVLPGSSDLKDRTHCFSQFGSGTLLPGVCTLISKSVLIHPENLLRENEALARHDIRDGLCRMFIDLECFIVTPYHKLINQLQEMIKRHSSTCTGVSVAALDREAVLDWMAAQSVSDIPNLTQETVLKCSACGKIRVESDYSAAQKKKKGQRKCVSCISAKSQGCSQSNPVAASVVSEIKTISGGKSDITVPPFATLQIKDCLMRASVLRDKVNKLVQEKQQLALQMISDYERQMLSPNLAVQTHNEKSAAAKESTKQKKKEQAFSIAEDKRPPTNNTSAFNEHSAQILANMKALYQQTVAHNTELLLSNWLSDFARSHRACFVRGADIVRAALQRQEVVLFEGSQGALLDRSFGFYPYVTKTPCSFLPAQHLLDEAGEPCERLHLGLMRTYLTRHGLGPFVSECTGTARRSSYLSLPDFHEKHNEDNANQGNMRLGYFDLVAVKYGLSILGPVDAICLTHTDKLNIICGASAAEWKVCIAYEYHGTASNEELDKFFELRQATDEFLDRQPRIITAIRPPTCHPERLQAANRNDSRLTRLLFDCRPAPLHSISLHGAGTSLAQAAVNDELSQPVRAFVSWLEAAVRLPVAIVSNGPTFTDKQLLMPLRLGN